MEARRVVIIMWAVAVCLGCASASSTPERPAQQPSAASQVQLPCPRSARKLETGVASYYADSLAGRSTASGEPYEPGKLTAAHKSLPFGTVVCVVHLDNRRSVVVTINDRGPFVRGRVIDLSRAAAQRLDLLMAGIAPVDVYLVSSPSADSQ